MAEGTALRGTPFSALVSGVIELHVKTLSESCWKRLHRRLSRVKAGMTDRAHRPIFVLSGLRDELVQMTADTRLVAGKLEFTLLALSLMARVTFKLFVLRDLVRELVEVRSRNLCRDRRQSVRTGEG